MNNIPNKKISSTSAIPHPHRLGRLTALSLGVLTMLAARAEAPSGDSVSASASASAGSVIITGQRASMSKSAAAQEKADNIVSVISSDDIGGLPDKNAAEALARLPGVAVQRDQGEGRYVSVRGLGPDLNAVTINGALVPSPEASRRAVALDVLPAGLIRSLEVVKTLTPDMDANSLGGTVEVKSLSAFDLPGKLLSGTIGGSHDENLGKTSPAGSVLWADRFLDGRLGVATGLSYEKREFGSDNVETGSAWDGKRLGALELRDYQPTRVRKALSLNLDYLPQPGNHDGNRYYLRSFLSKFSDDEVRDRLTVSNIEGSDGEDGFSEGDSATVRAERRLRQRKYTQTIRSVVLGTEQHLGDWKLDLVGGASRSSEDTPESINDARFRGTSNFNGVSFTDTAVPQLSGPSSLYDASSYKLNSITLQQRYSLDKEHHVKFDVEHKFDLGEAEATLRFGAKSSRREKSNDTNQWQYNSSKSSSGNYWGTGSTSMSAFTSDEQVDYALGSIGSAIDPALVRARVAGLARAPARLVTESTVDDYRMHEDIDAAYVQNSLAFGKWHVLAGVRAEHTKFRAAGWQLDDEAASQLSRERSYTDWLPSLQARYDLNRSTSIRAALTHAVVRANFSQLAPGVSLESGTEATIGNPDLNPLKARNLDLGIERMLGSGGNVSAYVFHKRIKDFTYTTDLAGTGQWQDYTSAVSYANGDRASVSGIELAYTQPLRMLPAPFNNLLIGANGSLTNSSASVARYDGAAGRELSRDITLPGQSRRVLNLMVGYEQGPLSTRLALNYKSPYLLDLGADILDASQDTFVDSQKQIDLSVSWQLNKRMQLMFDAANLNNEKYYVYQGTQKYNAQYEQYGRTYKLTLKASMF
jgi:TonB-dependent receptor